MCFEIGFLTWAQPSLRLISSNSVPIGYRFSIGEETRSFVDIGTQDHHYPNR